MSRMFAALENLSNIDLNITPCPTAATVVTVTTGDQPQQNPPTRFGISRTILPKDPDKSVIQIVERVNLNNQHDYLVYISAEIREHGTYYAELISLLRTVKSGSKVDIYISSPGGSLNTGAMIANAAKNSQAVVTTVAIGIVASAAALIWSHGHQKVVADGAVLMFHMSSHGDMGNSRAIQIRAENIVKYVKEVAIDPLVEQGILLPEEASEIIDRRRDFWLDSTTVNSRLEARRG